MSTKKFGDKLEELDLSHEEIDRLTKCMKDKKFRDLLKEYAEEISDPVNRKKYEEEIAMLERDRGMDVKFINPKPGHVLKTNINGQQKCFINICTNENLGQPKSRPSVQGKTKGMQWSIPHSVSQAREDVDKAGTKCIVYDVVFHPDTYYLLKKDARFKKMIHDTALDAIERQFDVKLDKVNIRTPKMSFKGLPMSSVIRTPNPNGPLPSQDPSLENVDMRLQPPYPPDSFNGSTASGLINGNKSREKEYEDVKTTKSEQYHTPHYTITHRGHFDIQNFRNSSSDVHDTRPKELVINIDLPLLSAANSVNLEIFEKRLRLDSEKPAKYKLDFELPYSVAENKGYAKFDKSRHRLTVTLEVLPAPQPPKIVTSKAPSLVTEAEQSNDCIVDQVNGQPNKADDKRYDNKLEIDQAPVSRLIEATEATMETVLTDISATKPKKEPTFIEEGRRHYQAGSHWKDDDHEQDTEVMSDAPLTKNSAFLIDMVMKYEGLIRRCPQYAFHQDESHVTFVIEVPHIFEQSLWYAVYGNMLQFCCLSECLDDDMVNSVFQLWIEFEQGFTIAPQKSRVDVSGNNAVFCLAKSTFNLEWQQVKAGFDKDNLETRRFSTTRNVCELYTLVSKHADGADAGLLGVCEVVKKEKDLVIIKFKEEEPNDKEPNDKEPNDKEQAFNKEHHINKEEVNSNNKEISEPRKVSFAHDVQVNTKQCSEQDHVDSDEEDASIKGVLEKDTPAQGVLTIQENGNDDEIIVNHVTNSAIDLASERFAYELDDDI